MAEERSSGVSPYKYEGADGVKRVSTCRSSLPLRPLHSARTQNSCLVGSLALLGEGARAAAPSEDCDTFKKGTQGWIVYATVFTRGSSPVIN